MSIDRLRYFTAVVETRNLRKASKLVGISPPSMSKAISALEKELGCQLIHPEGRGIGITPKGIEVYRLATPLLEENRRFYKRLKENETHSTQLRIATFEVFSSYFLAEFFSIEREFDALVLEMTPGKIEQAILSGVVDLGITYLPSPDPALEYVEIGSFEMGIFGTKTWQEVPFDQWPFAIPTTELRIHSSEIDALDLWPKSAPKRKIKYQFELLETALQAARKGLSVLHCPDFIVQLHNTDIKNSLQLVQLKPPAAYKASKPVKCHLVTRKGAVPVQIERKLAKFTRLLNQTRSR
jgi:DNA-binding transcriptional LysR family regulator